MQRTDIPIETKLKLKLYDIDGCLFHKFRDSGNKPIDTWLIDTNKAFLDSEIAEIKSNKYNKVIIAYGTNRQDFRCDRYNASRNGSASCTPVLPILQKHFASNLDCPVLLDPFWMADIYGQNLAAGTSYKLALKQESNTDAFLKHADWVFDTTKISLLYAHIHRVATLNPDTIIDVDFYDDTPEILEDLHNFFNMRNELLPTNVTLHLYHYAGGEITPYRKELKGAGPIDKNYEWSVRLLSSMSYYPYDFASKDLNIRTADALLAYHENDHYHFTDRKLKMTIQSNFYLYYKHFADMRDNKIPTLVDHSTLGNESRYTTAEELYKEIATTPKPATTSGTLFSSPKIEEGFIPGGMVMWRSSATKHQ